MKSFLLGIAVLSSVAAPAADRFWLQCGSSYLVDKRKPVTTLVYSAGAHQTVRLEGRDVNLGPSKQMLDAFQVPEINRAAYKAYRLELPIQSSACTSPATEKDFLFSCDDKTERTLVLKATTVERPGYSPKPNDFTYEHKLSVKGITLTTDRVGSGRNSYYYLRTTVKFGGITWTQDWGHHCGYMSCYRNDPDGGWPLKFDHGRTIDCTGG